MRLRLLVSAAVLLVLVHCSNTGGERESCSVATLDGGAVLVTCPDGTASLLPGGSSACSVEVRADGSKVVSCADGTVVVVPPGGASDGGEPVPAEADAGAGTSGGPSDGGADGETGMPPDAGIDPDAGTAPDGGLTAPTAVAASASCGASLPSISASGRYLVDFTGLTPVDPSMACRLNHSSSFVRMRFFTISLAENAAVSVRASGLSRGVHASIHASCAALAAPRTCDGDPSIPAYGPGTWVVALWAEDDGIATVDVDIVRPVPALDFAPVDRCGDVDAFVAALRPLELGANHSITILPGPGHSGTWHQDGVVCAGHWAGPYPDAVTAFRTDQPASVVVTSGAVSPDFEPFTTVSDDCATTTCDGITDYQASRTWFVGPGIHYVKQRWREDGWISASFVLRDPPPPPSNASCATASSVALSQNPTPLAGGTTGPASLYWKVTLPVASRIAMLAPRTWTAPDGNVSVSSACGVGAPLWTSHVGQGPVELVSPQFAAGTYVLTLETGSAVFYDFDVLLR